MKNKLLVVLLTLCMVATLLPTVALAAEPTAPSVEGINIYANGTPIKIVAGTTADYTNILYDKDNDTAIEDEEYLQIGSVVPTAAGYNLSGYTIYGGKYSGDLTDSKITINGGKVGSVYGGANESGRVDNVTLVMNGGSVGRLLICGRTSWASAGNGNGTKSSITINGGTVRGGLYDSVDLNARNNTGDTELIINGGVINGTIAIKGTGSFVIKGGSILGSIKSGNEYNSTPTNSTNPVCKITLTLEDNSGNTVNDTVVTALTLSSGSYGMNDVKTDATGKLYVYLPVGTKVTAATIDGVSYTNSSYITVTADGLASGDLTAVAPSALTGTVTISGTEKFGSELTATVTDDNNTGTLSYQWKRGETSIGTNSNKYTLVTADIGETITCIVSSTVETGTLSDSTGTIGKVDGPTAPTDLTAKKPCVPGGNTGSISGVNTTMEYSTSTDFSSKTPCTGTVIHNLEADTYYVRIAETDNTKAGAYATVIVPANTDYLTFADNAAYDNPAGNVGVTYTSTTPFTAEGGALPYTFTVDSTVTGLSINSENKLVYTRPAVGAATTATIKVTDALGTSKTITINIGEVTGKNVASATVSGISNKAYTGSAITQSGLIVKVGTKTLTAGTDYTVSYKNNVYPGSATVTITGKGNYSGTIAKTFTIAAPVLKATSSVTNKLYGHDDIQANCANSNVKTGDFSPMYICIILAIVSGAAVLFLTFGKGAGTVRKQ